MSLAARARAVLPGVGVAAVLLLAGCGERRTGDGPPPATLRAASAAEIEQSRLQKDETFRRDPDSPIPPALRAGFQRLEYFPFTEALRFPVKLHRYPGGLPLTIYTTGGKPRPAAKVGYVDFVHEGRTYRLQVYHLADLEPQFKDELFLPFLDATSGTETYGAGRYLDLAPAAGDWYVLDFNLAYHPLCAYGRTDYACPRTPEENRLPFAVRAGERGWATHGGSAEPASLPAVPGR